MAIPSIDSSVFFVLIGLFAGLLVTVVSCSLLAYLSGVISRRNGHTVAQVAQIAQVAQEPLPRPVTRQETVEQSLPVSTPARSVERPVTAPIARPEPKPIPKAAVGIPEDKPEPEPARRRGFGGVAHYQYMVSGQTKPFETLMDALSAFPEEAAKYDKEHRPSWKTIPAYVRDSMTRTFVGGSRR